MVRTLGLTVAVALVLAACGGGQDLGAPELDPNRTGTGARPEASIGLSPTPSAAPGSPGAEAVAVCTPGPGADCAKAILPGAVLTGVNLRGADLSEAVLVGADLRGADLHGADLSGADLDSADLTGADMRQSIFSHATFRYTNLTGVDMREAEGREGQLSRARLCETILPDGTENVRGCLNLSPSPAATPEPAPTI